jgi:hypothetical protein
MIDFRPHFVGIGRSTMFCIVVLVAGFALAAQSLLDPTFVALALGLSTIVAGRAVAQDNQKRKAQPKSE